MDPLIKDLTQLGALGVLAAMFYYQNSKNSLEFARRAEEVSKEFASRIEAVLNVERGRTEMLVKLVTDNTTQTATNNTLVSALHRRLDREEYEKNKEGGK